MKVSTEFTGLKLGDYLRQFEEDMSVRYIEPMSAHEIDIENYEVSTDEFAELKYDGHRGLSFIGEKIRVFSRRISKKSGWFSENSDQVPHIRDMDVKGLAGTVLDGEFDYGNTSMGVQSVMGSLPERAVKFQEENGYIPFKAFDILYYKGINIQRMPLWKRKVYLAKAIMELNSIHVQFAAMYMTNSTAKLFGDRVYGYSPDYSLENFITNHVEIVKDYGELYSEVIGEEQEGIMMKSMDGIYEQKRSKSYLKVKGQSTWDCVVMGFNEPTKEYTGKEESKWNYWEADGELIELEGKDKALEWSETQGVSIIPVTKPYFNGWCGGIKFGVWRTVEKGELKSEFGAKGFETMTYNGEIIFDREEGGKTYYRVLVQVGDCKGLTEKIMRDIKMRGNELVGTVIEVKANGIIDEEIGSLRHPRFKKFRNDKETETCTWENHIRKL